MAFFNPHKVYPKKSPIWMEELQTVPYTIEIGSRVGRQARPHGRLPKPPLIKKPNFEKLEEELVCSQEEIVATKKGVFCKTKRTVKFRTTAGRRECFVDVPNKRQGTKCSCNTESLLNRKFFAGLISTVCLFSLMSLVLAILLLLGIIKTGCECGTGVGK